MLSSFHIITRSSHIVKENESLFVTQTRLANRLGKIHQQFLRNDKKLWEYEQTTGNKEAALSNEQTGRTTFDGNTTPHICSLTECNATSQVQLEKQSETTDLRQRHVVRQVAAPYLVWQRFPLCLIESNVNKNFKVIQNPGFLPDHSQNWITCSFCHSRHYLKISERSFHDFLSYLANTQTDRQTNYGKNITSLAEVNIFLTDITTFL